MAEVAGSHLDGEGGLFDGEGGFFKHIFKGSPDVVSIVSLKLSYEFP